MSAWHCAEPAAGCRSAAGCSRFPPDPFITIPVGNGPGVERQAKSVHRLEGVGRGMVDLEQPLDGCCQTNANQSLQGRWSCLSSRAEITPLGKSGGTVELELVA